MSEDCLYLSIWSKNITREESTSVMVVLDSGRLGDDVSGIELSDTGDIVVVSVENRHGALGFLATKEKTVTGISDIKVNCSM